MIGADAFGLGLEAANDAVAQCPVDNLFDTLVTDMNAALRPRKLSHFPIALAPPNLPCYKTWNQGKPLEVDGFNGVVVALLEKSGKAARINQSFYTCANI